MSVVLNTMLVDPEKEFRKDVIWLLDDIQKRLIRVEASLNSVQQPHAVKVEDSHIPEAGTSA